MFIRFLFSYSLLCVFTYADNSSLVSKFFHGEELFVSRSGDVKKFPARERHALKITSNIPVVEAEEPFSVQGHVDVSTQTYLNRPKGKHKNNITLSERINAKYKKDNFSAYMSFYAQQDSWDLSEKKNQNKRSYVRLDELYVKYNLGNSELMLGKNIRFWGALELRNIVDVFNLQDTRNDPFQIDKLGAWNAAYTYYTDNGELSLIVKDDEQDRSLSAFPYVYNYFSKEFIYDENLYTEGSYFRPNIYLTWAGSTETEYALDYAFILQNGYDSQRYTTLNRESNMLNENAYFVTKFMTYDTLVMGSSLLKLEALYADVKSDSLISDYYQVGVGVEHTLGQIYGDSNLGLLAEYYRYDTLEKDKRDDLSLFEVFQNDLFLGLRYTFNEGNDASIVSGVVLDLEYDEEAYYFEYESRLAKDLKVNFDYRYLNPSKDEATVYQLLERHQRFNLTLGYYF
jgi:hypothetical protein